MRGFETTLVMALALLAFTPRILHSGGGGRQNGAPSGNPVPGAQQGQREVDKAAVETGSGLQTVIFHTLEGRVVANVPDDLAVGEPFSWTVSSEPAGTTDAERQANLSVLSGYVVDIEQQQAPVSLKTRSTVLGATVAAGLAAVSLRNRSGAVVSRAGVSCAPSAATPPAFDEIRARSPAASPLRLAGRPLEPGLPTLGEAGQPLPISGTFDFARTRVRIGGQDAELLAGSPRKLVVRTPAGVVGPARLEVANGSAQVTGPYRNVRLVLSAETRELQKAQRTRFTVAIEGLAGLEKEFSFVVRNLTPDIVRMEGGERKAITVRPRDVRAGIFTASLQLTGIRAGAFEIQALLGLCPDLCSPAGATRVAYVWQFFTKPGKTPNDRDCCDGLPASMSAGQPQAPPAGLTAVADLWIRPDCDICQSVVCWDFLVFTTRHLVWARSTTAAWRKAWSPLLQNTTWVWDGTSWAPAGSTRAQLDAQMQTAAAKMCP